MRCAIVFFFKFFFLSGVYSNKMSEHTAIGCAIFYRGDRLQRVEPPEVVDLTNGWRAYADLTAVADRKTPAALQVSIRELYVGNTCDVYGYIRIMYDVYAAVADLAAVAARKKTPAALQVSIRELYIYMCKMYTGISTMCVARCCTSVARLLHVCCTSVADIKTLATCLLQTSRPLPLVCCTSVARLLQTSRPLPLVCCRHQDPCHLSVARLLHVCCRHQDPCHFPSIGREIYVYICIMHTDVYVQSIHCFRAAADKSAHESFSSYDMHASSSSPRCS
jgi:hypothetical protein